MVWMSFHFWETNANHLVSGDLKTFDPDTMTPSFKAWRREDREDRGMNYGRFASYEEFLKELTLFHGKPRTRRRPSRLHMVNMAWEVFPKDVLMDVICETRKCLADTIQLLTPCTVGNHWLKIVDTGRFAGVFYDKQTGEGGPASPLSMERLKLWPRVEEWYLKLTPKHEQSLQAILDEINAAGAELFDMIEVTVEPEVLKVRPKTPPVFCPDLRRGLPARPRADLPWVRGDLTNSYYHSRTPAAAGGGNAEHTQEGRARTSPPSSLSYSATLFLLETPSWAWGRKRKRNGAFPQGCLGVGGEMVKRCCERGTFPAERGSGRGRFSRRGVEGRS